MPSYAAAVLQHSGNGLWNGIMRRVISLWLPRFATDRLSRRQPAWRSKPLVTVCDGGLGGGSFGAACGPPGARDGSGLVMRVAAANRAAEAEAGIVPGLPLTDARARLLDLRAVPAEGGADMEALAALGDWCGRWTPWVTLDAAGPDAVLGASHGLWLDITGCAHLFGGEMALLNDIALRLARFGFAARAALADTPGAAWAVAHHGAMRHVGAQQGEIAKHMCVVAPGKICAALAKLPLKGLRLAPVEVEGLERLGFRAIGDLYGIPRGALARRFGAMAARVFLPLESTELEQSGCGWTEIHLVKIFERSLFPISQHLF